jgi:membrane protease YdiL (CAAX protease family)
MTLKRLLLIGLTLLAALLSSWSLIASWQKPQFQDRLELYQTDIILQAQAWQPENSQDRNFQSIQAAILGENPLESATKQYKEAIASVAGSLDQAKNQLAKLDSAKITSPTSPADQTELQQSVNQLQKLSGELELHLGILQAQQGDTDSALRVWQELLQKLPPQVNDYAQLEQTARVLAGIWDSSPTLLPNAQHFIQQNLTGWFRSTALIQVYQLQQRQDALSEVKADQQVEANKAIVKLAIIAIIPSLAAFIGFILLIFLLGQLLIKREGALLAQNATERWSTPWTGETVLQVFVLGFVLMGQLFVPLILGILPIPRSANNARVEAFSVLVSYLIMSAGAILVLYFSIKRFFPLSESWFRYKFTSRSLLWGCGGYCVALPIVVIVSLINQQIWQGNGGSNPLLQLALESQDLVALGILFVTAAICAPFFEELLFRGFLLPSLTRYLPVWGAILASSLLFAIAHLSLSEIFPLTALGIVLGVVYTRSRNLLTSMLVHALWNSGTLMSLFILGSN